VAFFISGLATDAKRHLVAAAGQRTRCSSWHASQTVLPVSRKKRLSNQHRSTYPCAIARPGL